mmetsp:Transcript_25617/g.43731  ORF Transcript_25617/g.43731 Transcript_25617/m.43731 type:complete len:129 (+) Transcript_25617:260-646(+)
MPPTDHSLPSSESSDRSDPNNSNDSSDEEQRHPHTQKTMTLTKSSDLDSQLLRTQMSRVDWGDSFRDLKSSLKGSFTWTPKRGSGKASGIASAAAEVAASIDKSDRSLNCKLLSVKEEEGTCLAACME